MQRQQISRPVSDRSLQIPPASCIGKTVIERNHLERWRPTLRGWESRRQWQCIGNTQRVNTNCQSRWRPRISQK